MSCLQKSPTLFERDRILLNSSIIQSFNSSLLHPYDCPLLPVLEVKVKVIICCKPSIHIRVIFFRAAKLLLIIDLTKQFVRKMLDSSLFCCFSPFICNLTPGKCGA